MCISDAYHVQDEYDPSFLLRLGKWATELQQQYAGKIVDAKTVLGDEIWHRTHPERRVFLVEKLDSLLKSQLLPIYAIDCEDGKRYYIVFEQKLDTTVNFEREAISF